MKTGYRDDDVDAVDTDGCVYSPPALPRADEGRAAGEQVVLVTRRGDFAYL